MNLYQSIIAGSCVFFAWSCKHQPANSKVIRHQEAIQQLEHKSAIANPPLDKSSMDVSYFPQDFTVQKMGGKVSDDPVARVLYSRPAVGGRTIFGDIVKYGKPWRLGANEATEIEFFEDVTINNKEIKKGRYTLYCIPYEKYWELKLNSSLYTWGLKIDPQFDLFTFKVNTETLPFKMEYLSMQFIPDGNDMELQISWDSVKVSLPIKQGI